VYRPPAPQVLPNTGLHDRVVHPRRGPAGSAYRVRDPGRVLGPPCQKCEDEGQNSGRFGKAKGTHYAPGKPLLLRVAGLKLRLLHGVADLKLGLLARLEGRGVEHPLLPLLLLGLGGKLHLAWGCLMLPCIFFHYRC
jgi:hypothetical protein